MYNAEGNSAVPQPQTSELQAPMPDHLVDPVAEENLRMEQGQMTPEEAGFTSLAEVIEKTQDVSHQVAANMDWPEQEAA